MKLAGQLLDMWCRIAGAQRQVALLQPQLGRRDHSRHQEHLRRRHPDQRALPRHHRRHPGHADEGHRGRCRRGRHRDRLMSLGPGHNPTESLVAMLEGALSTPPIPDMDRLIKIRDHFAKIRPKYAAFESATWSTPTSSAARSPAAC